MKPKLMFYQDFARTKPMETFDFGEVDLGDTKDVTIYMYNYGEAELRKIRVTSKNKDIKVIAHPTQLVQGETKKLMIAWAPTEKDLDAELEVTGIYAGK